MTVVRGNAPRIYLATAAPPLQLTTRLSSKSWVSIVENPSAFSGTDGSRQLGDEHSDEEDPFAEVRRIVLLLSPRNSKLC